MNREILFRGKRKDNGEWVEGFYMKHINRQISPIGDTLKPEDIEHLILTSGFADWNMPRQISGFEVDPDTVGQYVGINDKNGTKIFEGDIVKNKDGHFGRMAYNHTLMAFECIKKKHGGCWHSVGINKSWEIIGNIHEQEDPQ